jgi:hypothetical protein
MAGNLRTAWLPKKRPHTDTTAGDSVIRWVCQQDNHISQLPNYPITQLPNYQILCHCSWIVMMSMCAAVFGDCSTSIPLAIRSAPVAVPSAPVSTDTTW